MAWFGHGFEYLTWRGSLGPYMPTWIRTNLTDLGWIKSIARARFICCSILVAFCPIGFGSGLCNCTVLTSTSESSQIVLTSSMIKQRMLKPLTLFEKKILENRGREMFKNEFESKNERRFKSIVI